MNVIDKMKEGDIFRWRYREGTKHGDYAYHCCSNIAVFKNGRLRDTYWHGYATSSDGRSWMADECHKLDLTFLANESDLEPAQAYQAEYYDHADIVNITHANGGSFYLRKGAVRSQAKMLESARYKLEKSESDKQMAEWRSERLREAIAKIEAGDTTAHI